MTNRNAGATANERPAHLQLAGVGLDAHGHLVQLDLRTIQYLLNARAVSRRSGWFRTCLWTLRTITRTEFSGTPGKLTACLFAVAGVIALLPLHQVLRAGLEGFVNSDSPVVSRSVLIFVAELAVLAWAALAILRASTALALLAEAARGASRRAEVHSQDPDWSLVRAIRGQIWAVLPPDASQEGTLARKAIALHEQISRVASGDLPMSSSHRVQVDADWQILDLVNRLIRLSNLRSQLHSNPDTSTTQPESATQQLTKLDQVEQSLAARVDALAAYADQLQRTAGRFLYESEATTLTDDAVRGLLADTAADTKAIEDLDRLRAELEAEADQRERTAQRSQQEA